MVPGIYEGPRAIEQNISKSASVGKIHENLFKIPLSKKKFKFTCNVI
jgi:hypothetical protein